jgi:regulation of enolase protein 1 (concanavalin A-like superfamily)
MEWLHEPPVWGEQEGHLTVTTGPEGDYWRVTHYGFVHDNGHFRYQKLEGEFTVTLAFEADFAGLYDQAGLMLRIDENHWIKAGIEFFEERFHFSVVVTHGHSDWSIRDWPASPRVWVRATRRGDAVSIEASADGETFTMLRLAYLEPDVPVMVGPMTCSPLREGLTARFGPLQIGPAIEVKA